MNHTTPLKDTLLVVDDIPDNLKILLDFLTQAGFNVLIAQDGEEGIQAAEYAHPDLILLDVMMPGINGFEVCEQLKYQEETKEIPIIFMTALTDIVDKVKGFELGAADYITKPIQHEEVLARVTTHLNLCKLQQQMQDEINRRKEAEISLIDANNTLAERTIQLQARTIELQERTVELERRNMELDAFAHTVAHDLKNPLSAVIGLTDVLAQYCEAQHILSPKWMERIQLIGHAGQQMRDIIDAILLLAGVSRQGEITIHPLDMPTIIAEVQQRLRPMLEEYQGQMRLPTTWPTAEGYPPWIGEVWMNYLTNAIKYGGHPPQLALSAECQENNMIQFGVRDNGAGLTADACMNLFTPFTRLHQTRLEGHGLGLSIVKQIVEKLGGQVGVESQLGQGSFFYFTLPRHRE
jgi:signal transduction histidine kinase